MDDQTTTEVEDTPQDLGWCIVELMGHRRLGGYVREVEIAGAPMLRVDVPDMATTVDVADGGFAIAATQFYSASALYCLTPVTEDMARVVARNAQPEPVHRWELPAAPTDAEPVAEAEEVW